MAAATLAPEDDKPRQRARNRVFPIYGCELEAFAPPQKINTCDWIEANVCLPALVSDTPGLMALFPYQREIVEACDTHERVTWQKCARVGATTLMVAIMASYVKNDPKNILFVEPTEDDSRDHVTGFVEPLFAASPSIAGLLAEEEKRSTITSRIFPGGWAKFVGAAPRNMRRHFVHKLFLDEVDSYAPAPTEGDIVSLAVNRTRTARNRLIFTASTPTDAETSRIAREYEASDKRIYEICCPGCAEFFEPQWKHVKCDKTEDGAHLPDTAHLVCPHNGCVIEAGQKAEAVAKGRWRATAPNVKNHAGFKCSALISTIEHASWAQIVREFLDAKKDPDKLRSWTNTILGDTFHDQTGEGMESGVLSARAESFGLQALPSDVLCITGGVDVQGYGLELVTLGHSETQTFVLAYETVTGKTDSDETWRELSDLLARRFTHPLGGTLGYDACAIDAGDGNTHDKVLGYTRPRFGRRIVATIGRDGTRPMIERSSKPWLYICGVDGAKTSLFMRLKEPGHVRFSANLPERYYEELVSERRVTHFHFGQPKKRWERIKGMRAEGLDSTIYALCVRNIVNMDPTRRENELRGVASPVTVKTKSDWMSGGRQ